MRGNNTQRRDNRQDREPKEFEEKVVQINRVSKKTKGGNQSGFSALVVVGNKKGKVGVGLGKAKDVASAVQKGVKKAKRKMLDIPMDGTTIPFAINMKLGAAHILLKPAPPGSGIIAGGAVRAVVDAAGIRDISSKIKGTSNQASNVYATLEALRQIRDIVANKGIVLKSAEQVEREEKEALKRQFEKEHPKEVSPVQTEQKVEQKKKPEVKKEQKVEPKPKVEPKAEPKTAPKTEVKEKDNAKA